MSGCSRFQSSFEAIWTARQLANISDNENFVPAFASANIKILPYQIVAACFALRSTNLKGCILCDEGSLGKTYEALLVVFQRWYEGKEHILIVLPIRKWTDISCLYNFIILFIMRVYLFCKEVTCIYC